MTEPSFSFFVQIDLTRRIAQAAAVSDRGRVDALFALLEGLRAEYPEAAAEIDRRWPMSPAAPENSPTTEPRP